MQYSPKSGFTLIEILVVLGIIGVLLSVLYVSFDAGRASSRDAQRKTDLTQLQLAIELYKSQKGYYPAEGCGSPAATSVDTPATADWDGGSSWTGPGPHSESWGNNTDCENWIVGLVPDYIDELPEDPRFEDEDNRGYLYRTDATGSWYKIMLHNTPESQLIESYEEKFARCPVNKCDNSHCPASPGLPQPGVYALYSRGAECD